MKATAQAKFSVTLLLNGNGFVMRGIAGCSVGMQHSNKTSSIAGSVVTETTLANVNSKS